MEVTIKIQLIINGKFYATGPWCQITSAYIQSMQFPFTTYGMVLIYRKAQKECNDIDR